MKSTTWNALLALVVIGVVFSLGCPQQGADRPKTFPVSGTVTLNGQPVEGAIVTFVPTAGGKGATGRTDASGKYTLTTFASGDGAVPGQYNVKIVKFETTGTEAAAGPGGAEMDEEAYTAAQDAAQEGGEEEAAGAPKNLLPEKYADPATSGLKATVKEGDNTIDFALEG